MERAAHAGSTGVCKYCGQIVSLSTPLPHITEAHDLDYWATRRCDCPQAQVFKRREGEKEVAAQRREEAIFDAHAQIDAKFGEMAAEVYKDPDMTAVDNALIRLLKDAAPLIYDGIISSFTVRDNDGMRATMKMDTKVCRVAVYRDKSKRI